MPSVNSASWKPIRPMPDRAVAHVRVPRLRDRVVVHVDHVVEHPYGRTHGLLQTGVVDTVRGDVLREVDRAQVADRDLVDVRVQGDLGAQVRGVHDTAVLLRRTQVARVLERDPRVAGLEQHGQHAPPQVDGLHPTEDLDVAVVRHLLVRAVLRGELVAERVVQVRHLVRREQRPLAVRAHPADELVRHPVRGVHVMRAAALVTGVLAQVEELLDVDVPRLQVRADRALATASLIHGYGCVVGNLEERHDALRLAVGALDVGADAAHRRPVIAEPAGELAEQRVVADAVEDAGEIVVHGGQEARRELRRAWCPS